MPLSILIVDDHPLVRDALRQAAAQAVPDAALRACGSLKDAEAGLAADGPADLVMLDLKLPDAGGLAGLMLLHKNAAARRILVVSASDSEDTIRRARVHGAAGYASKSAPLAELVERIRAVLDDRGWEGAPALEEPQPNEATDLTPAQLRVLIGLAEGRLNKQIAYDMSISEATVKAHVTAVFRKLGVRNRTQAVIAAQALQLTQADA